MPTSISLCGVCKNSLNPFQFMYHIRRLDDFGRSFNTIPQNQNIYHVLKGWNGLTTASTKQNISSRCKIYLMFYNNIVTGCLKENIDERQDSGWTNLLLDIKRIVFFPQCQNIFFNWYKVSACHYCKLNVKYNIGDRMIGIFSYAKISKSSIISQM